jgi:hypothetical protein
MYEPLKNTYKLPWSSKSFLLPHCCLIGVMGWKSHLCLEKVIGVQLLILCYVINAPKIGATVHILRRAEAGGWWQGPWERMCNLGGDKHTPFDNQPFWLHNPIDTLSVLIVSEGRPPICQSLERSSVLLLSLCPEEYFPVTSVGLTHM